LNPGPAEYEGVLTTRPRREGTVPIEWRAEWAQDEVAERLTAALWVSKPGVRAMAQVVSRRLLPQMSRFVSESVHVGFMVEKVALGQVFLRGLRFSLSVSFHRGSK
jgi:hypothetical protein